MKTAFAVNLLRVGKSDYKSYSKIAFEVCSDTSFALQIANAWPRDPFVIDEMTRLIGEQGNSSFLPDKEKQGRDIYAICLDDKVDVEVRLKAHRLYAEIFGHIVKEPAAPFGINISQNVMVVRDMGSNEDWERGAIKQQRALLDDHAADN